MLSCYEVCFSSNLDIHGFGESCLCISVPFFPPSCRCVVKAQLYSDLMTESLCSRRGGGVSTRTFRAV